MLVTKTVPILAAAVAMAALLATPIGTAGGAPASAGRAKNFLTVIGPQKQGTTGASLREEVDCPKGWFAINGGYLTSGIVVSTLKNFAVRHPDGWVAEVYAPPAPPPLAPQDDVTLTVKVDCARTGIPLVLPAAAARARASKAKAKNFTTVVGPVKEGKSGDVLSDEVHCPSGWTALNGGYVASGIILSTWKNFPVRHPDGWAVEVYAPPNGPFGPAQDISLRVKVDCAKSGIPVVLPIGTTSRVAKPRPKNFMTVYGKQKTGRSGDKLSNEVDCPKGWTAFNGGAQASGVVVATWESFPARHPDGWVAEIYAPPAGPYAPVQDVSLDVKVDCAKGGIPVVLPRP